MDSMVKFRPGSRYVLKVNFCGVVRRLTLTKADEFLFTYVQSATRDLFGLPACTLVEYTYVDRDGDAIAFVDDKDVYDALILQALKPLRITMIKRDFEADAQVEEGRFEGNEKERSAKAPGNDVVSKPVDVGADAGGNRKEKGIGNMKTVSTSRDGARDGAVESSNVHGDIHGDGLSMMPITDISNIHRGTCCRACNKTPITGPLFSDLRLLDEFCLWCFYERSKAERGRCMRIDHNFYRLAHPTFDVKIHAAAFSLQKSGGSVRREDGCSDKSRQMVHLGIQCDECGMEPIRGPRFRKDNGVKYNLCLPCYKKNGSDDKQYFCLESSSASEGYLAISNEIIPLTPAHNMPDYACYCCVSLLDPWTISVRETSRLLEKADSGCPKCTGHGLPKMKREVKDYREWLENEEVDCLSAEPTIMDISDNHTEVSFGYVVRSCNDIHRA